ncbi:TetR/AcrR family transcriptional regulator [Xenorhabdus sp. 12]|uniref:TetR/AcrR family transcriptional regulator n=1 Tax=Xenorhabdus santafensis TaxID=2582833 RepID=A0ABU4S680_9GAMM|nr:TetR/AcrR family transcriptional regulator [Xenorhabdus sp. 12]MDX7986144.1 TetR/AcrR family transcriptional regulator [Xenorhabdus sp. 12]
MGRRKTIDREVLLDAAEQIVTTQGAAALTIDAVAKAVGITKGGVQYNFGTKDALIDAMFERWGESYDQQFQKIAGENPNPLTAMHAHVEATRQSDAASTAKAAGLMAALLQTPERLKSTKAWYQERMAGLDMATVEGRQARLAFLATEGAFILRFFGLMEMNEDEWEGIFDDISTLMPSKIAE